MEIGSFGNTTFEISEKNLFTLNNEINRSYKSKVIEHNPIYGPALPRHQGRELIELSFGINLVSTLVDSVKEELDNLKAMLEFGEYNFLILGGQVFGEHPFLITGIEEKNQYFNKELGEFDYIEVSLTLKEYIEDLKLYHKNLEGRKIIRSENQKLLEESSEDVESEQKEVVQE